MTREPTADRDYAYSPTDQLAVPTTWRVGFFEAERVHKADGRYEIVLTICSETISGQPDFTVGFLVPPEALALALTGLDRQPCQVRVYDAEDVE